MKEETTVALWDENMEQVFELQMTGWLASCSPLQYEAADHWAYSLRSFSWPAVMASWVLSDNNGVSGTLIWGEAYLVFSSALVLQGRRTPVRGRQ